MIYTFLSSCVACKGQGIVYERDQKKKRVKSKNCPVCGGQGRTLTYQGNLNEFLDQALHKHVARAKEKGHE